MNTNTHPVRALIGEMTEYLDQVVDPELDVIEQWRDRLEAALSQQPAAPTLAKRQPCGCVICTCEDEQQCQGCGAKHCGNRADHPPYVVQQSAAVDEAMVERATTAYLQSRGTYEGEVPVDRDDIRAALAAALAAPMADVELLPLPEWTKRDDLGGLVPSEVRAEMRAYIRANIAPLQAENERLRDALETIAAYPYSRDQEMGAAAMRKVARDALAQEDRNG